MTRPEPGAAEPGARSALRVRLEPPWVPTAPGKKGPISGRRAAQAWGQNHPGPVAEVAEPIKEQMSKPRLYKERESRGQKASNGQQRVTRGAHEGGEKGPPGAPERQGPRPRGQPQPGPTWLCHGAVLASYFSVWLF